MRNRRGQVRKETQKWRLKQEEGNGKRWGEGEKPKALRKWESAWTKIEKESEENQQEIGVFEIFVCLFEWFGVWKVCPLGCKEGGCTRV